MASSNRVEPAEFHMKDLFIDVELIVCKDGTTYDFLGRKLFNTSFFRQDTGFGIIDIDVEVNTSLQPIVAITFKDLYGKTIFGDQKRIEGEGEKAQSLDYSVLFDWPPPKFLFTFKGYLGKSVTWILNLKRTSTSFNSSDGSYEVKCEFVPNQWGFFADLPMLFLLAAKPLRRERIGKNSSAEQKRKVTSVFDLIKIGKQVEVKTQDTTKDFDKLVKQLGSMKSGIATTLTGSRIISFGETINGVVNNIQVTGFNEIKIPSLSELDGSVNTEERINRRVTNPTSLSKLNTYLLLSLKFNNQSGFDLYGDGIPRDPNSINLSDEKVANAKNQVLERINENLRRVEDEIKRRVFKSSEKKLEKITIGEIFEQLAKDAAFVMGSILDAGIEGSTHKNYGPLRESLNKSLIGKAFPLFINDKGEEVPATAQNLGQDVGVDAIEMDFVRKFINAISEGVAKDLPTSDLTDSNQDATLKTRVNNLEMGQGNPYKSTYQNIATNILVRGGIVGYVTRSFDPNYPGDWGNWVFDNDGAEGVSELATKDMDNVTDSILGELSDYDVLLLKRFCRFFLRFYDRSGENLLDENGNEAGVVSSPGDKDKSWDYKVVMGDNGETLTFKQLFSTLNKPIIIQDENLLEDFPIEVTENDPGVGVTEVNVEHPLSFVDTATFTASRIVNNNMAYMVPDENANKYYIVVFERDLNTEAQKANSSKSDSELKNGEKDDPVNFLDKECPEGYVPIDALEDSEGNPLGRIGILRDYATDYKAVDGNKLRYPLASFYQKTDAAQEYINHTWRKFKGSEPAIYESADAAYNDNVDNLNKVSIFGSIGFTAYANFEDNTYVFGPFGDGGTVLADDNRAINQRVFIRRACEIILNKLSKIEDERNQVIGSVLGKAGEQENALYKQMHILYHQWQALAFDNSSGACGSSLNAKKNLADLLESRYGDKHVDMSLVGGESKVDGLPDGAFIYEFPLQRITGKDLGKDSKPIITRDSIISLEPMYKLNAETSVLNIIQQVCTKNNFLFVPIPGNASYLNVQDLYTPNPYSAKVEPANFFHVLFTPTPESRSKLDSKEPLALSENHKSYAANSFSIKYGSPDNQIVSNVQVGTDDNKVTAESIVNLQRLVDNENQNKKVTTDCSVLPVMEGRSYTASIEMLGNAQVYPMQFFFLENSPLFGGLYQVMKVKHSISPNNMKTNVEGIRMRFSPGTGYGSIKPITLDTYRDLGEVSGTYPFSPGEIEQIQRENVVPTNSATSSNGGAPKSSPKGKPSIVKTLIENGSTNGNIVAGNIKVATIPRISGIRNLKQGNARENYLIEEAVAPLEKMLKDYVSWLKSEGYSGIEKGTVYGYITGVFRDYQKQIEVKRQYGSAAAQPGSSPHGWGIAVDLQFFNKKGGIVPNTKNQPQYFKFGANPAIKWMYDNSYAYGFVLPWNLRDGSFLNEHWHFEYHGTKAKSMWQEQNVTYGYVAPVNREIESIVKNPKDKSGNRVVY